MHRTVYQLLVIPVNSNEFGETGSLNIKTRHGPASVSSIPGVSLYFYLSIYSLLISCGVLRWMTHSGVCVK